MVRTTRHLSVYQILVDWYSHCGFNLIDNSLLRDLSIIRLIEPTSKLQSIKLMAHHFLKKYSEIYVYRQLPKLGQLKSIAESTAIDFAKSHYNFSFSLVFYDVTNLYFESFTPDELRKCGFSKDSKSNQLQIVIGLVVDHQGFPISYGLFEGNTFEGHTMIPVILELKKKYQIDDLIIVADTETLLRLIQSIPSPNAEPFKLWLARVGYERLEETADPEIAINRALKTYL